MANDWTFSLSRVEAATRIAKERAARHWANKQWKLWTTFDSAGRVINPNWFDPYIENELIMIENDPTTNPADMMTINAYMVYCWYKYKGYGPYAIAALLTCHVQESGIQGGSWEWVQPAAFYQIHPFNGDAGSLVATDTVNAYSNLIGFPPAQGWANYTYFNRAGTMPEGHSYNYNWSTDGGNTIEYGKQILAYNPGELEAAQYKRPNPDNLGSGAISVPGQPRPVIYYYWISNAESDKWIYNRRYWGYGLVQWTNWTELREMCGLISGSMKAANEQEFSPGYDPQTGNYYTFSPYWKNHTGNIIRGYFQYHWQLSLTLHLMVLEFQRQNAMAVNTNVYPPTHDEPNGKQYGAYYYGEWTDTAGVNASNVSGTRPRYTHNCTWDEWASDEIMELAPDDLKANLTDDDEKIKFSMDMFRLCYLHTGPGEFHANARMYWFRCIQYWETVWSIKDIPRPREVEWLDFELDYWHIEQTNNFLTLAAERRRNRHNERTILL